MQTWSNDGAAIIFLFLILVNLEIKRDDRHESSQLGMQRFSAIERNSRASRMRQKSRLWFLTSAPTCERRSLPNRREVRARLTRALCGVRNANFAQCEWHCNANFPDSELSTITSLTIPEAIQPFCRLQFEVRLALPDQVALSIGVKQEQNF